MKLSGLTKEIVDKHNRLLEEVCAYYDLDIKKVLFTKTNGLDVLVTSAFPGTGSEIYTYREFLIYCISNYIYLLPFIYFHNSNIEKISVWHFTNINSTIRKIRKLVNSNGIKI